MFGMKALFGLKPAQRAAAGIMGAGVAGSSALMGKASGLEASSQIDTLQARQQELNLRHSAQQAQFEQQQLNIQKSQESSLGRSNAAFGYGNMEGSATNSFVNNSINTQASQDLTRANFSNSLATQSYQNMSNLYSQSISNIQSSEKYAKTGAGLGVGFGAGLMGVGFVG